MVLLYYGPRFLEIENLPLPATKYDNVHVPGLYNRPMAQILPKSIQQTDPDSASFENPLGPKDVTGLKEQAKEAKLPDYLSGQRVTRPGYSNG